MQLQNNIFFAKQQKLFCLSADVDTDSSKFSVVHVALKDSGVVTLARTSGPIQKVVSPNIFGRGIKTHAYISESAQGGKIVDGSK